MLLGLLLVLVPLGAPAQSSARAPSSAPVGVLEELAVTATRIAMDRDQMPFAVGQVGREQIQLGRQQLGLDESLAGIPGLFFQNRYNFAQELRISIRGFGARANFGIRGIRLVADDIPLTMPDGQGNVDSIDLGSAHSIEVIRGPVSAIYGAAGGGAIIVHSEDGAAEPFIAGRFNVGSYGYQQGQLKAGGQAGALNWMTNLSATALDGYRQQSQFKRTLWNSKFRYDFDETSSLTVVFNAVDAPRADDPGALTRGEVASDPRQAAPRNLHFDAGESLQQQKLGLVWHKTLSEQSDVVLRVHGIRRDFAGRLPFDSNSNGQGGRVELDRKVAGLGGHWSWHRPLGDVAENRLVMGFAVDAQRDLRARFVNDLVDAGALTTWQDEDVSTLGLFVENAVDVGKRLTLVAGARFDDMQYEVTDRTAAGASGKTGLTEFSPMAGVRWSPLPEVQIYGNVSTAFDPPTIAELANPAGPSGFNRSLGPQTATNYELGSKGLLAARLRYELAVFHIAVRDEIVPFELTGSGQSFFRNAGRSEHDGVEASLQAQWSAGFSAGASYTWSDFTFRDFSGLGGEVFDGKRIPGVPEHLAHFDLNWQHPSGWYAAADLLYAGAIYADNANTVRSGGYVVSSLRAGYHAKRPGWVFQPFIGINNLFDQAYPANLRINASFGRFYEPAPQRNLYGGMEIRLGL